MPAKKTKAPNTELEQEFATLSLKGMQADETFAKAEHSLYGALVNAYLFHRKVRDNKDFLQGKYEAAQVRENELAGNQINFRPFIRVVFRLDIPNMPPAERARKTTTVGSERVRVAQYKIIFEAFEEYWNANPDNFQTAAFEKLFQFIQSSTVRGLITEYKEKQAAIKNKKTNEDEKEVENTQKALADVALTSVLENGEVVAAASIKSPERLNYNSNRIAACICRINTDTGKIEIIATSTDEAAIRLIAQSNIAKLEQIESKALRTIAEVVATQSFPGRHIPGGDRDKLTGALKNWYKSVYLETSVENPHVTTQRRLVLRKDDIILSAQRTDSSVVTILKKPVCKLLPANSPDVFLKVELLRKIEEWLENKTIAARTTYPLNKLARPAIKTPALYVLQVSNTQVNSKPRNLFFYDIHDKEKRPGQVDFNETDFRPTWSFSVSRNWLRNVRTVFLDVWFELAASGRKLKRAENSIFSLKLSPSQFSVSYEIDGADDPPTAKFKIEPAAIFTAGKNIALMVKSKDFAPALSNIAELPIIGTVKFSGNKSVFVISFATDMGEYLVAIPTLVGTKLMRDRTQFKTYARWDNSSDAHD